MSCSRYSMVFPSLPPLLEGFAKTTIEHSGARVRRAMNREEMVEMLLEAARQVMTRNGVGIFASMRYQVSEDVAIFVLNELSTSSILSPLILCLPRCPGGTASFGKMTTSRSSAG